MKIKRGKKRETEIEEKKERKIKRERICNFSFVSVL